MMGIQEARLANFEEFKRDHLLAGFELETQRIFGVTYDRLASQVKEFEVEEIIPAETPEAIADKITFGDETYRSAKSNLIKRINRFLRDSNQDNFNGVHGYSSLYALYMEMDVTKSTTWIKSQLFKVLAACKRNEDQLQILSLIKTANKIELQKIMRVTYSTETKTVLKKIKKILSQEEFLSENGWIQSAMADDFDFKRDGSVSGAEITTKGGNGFLKVKELNQRMFSLLESKILVDRGCSYHIHVSVKDSTPKYGASMQASMTAAVFNHPQLPQSVRDRLAGNAYRQYFRGKISNEKYAAVAHRGRTWEFRLFGNIATKEDADTCLDIAAEVYYKAITGQLPKLSLPIGIDFSKVCDVAAENRLTFDEAISFIIEQEASDN